MNRKWKVFAAIFSLMFLCVMGIGLGVGNSGVQASLKLNAVSTVANNLFTLLQSWTGADIGTPGAVGNGLPVGKAISLHGAGVGVNPSGNDQGYFVWTPRTGDVEIVVKVLQVTGGAKSQVGIMLRESNNTNADMACALYEVPTSGNPLVRQAYRRPGYAINNTNTAPISVPVWLKLQRVGKTYATFRSTDGLI